MTAPLTVQLNHCEQWTKKTNYSFKNKYKKNLVNSLNEAIALTKYENIIWMDSDYSYFPDYI